MLSRGQVNTGKATCTSWRIMACTAAGVDLELLARGLTRAQAARALLSCYSVFKVHCRACMPQKRHYTRQCYFTIVYTINQS